VRTVAILLTPGFADWEYALIAGAGRPFYGLEVRFFGVEAGPLASQGGLAATVPAGLAELERWRPGVVVLVGGTAWTGAGAPKLHDLPVRLHGQGTVLAGICGGTLGLARAGLLEDVRHTSNAPGFLAEHTPTYRGAAHYVESAAAVSDNRVITAPGTAPASFAAAIFASAGVREERVAQFRAMMAAEHG